MPKKTHKPKFDLQTQLLAQERKIKKIIKDVASLKRATPAKNKNAEKSTKVQGLTMEMLYNKFPELKKRIHETLSK